LLVGEGAGLVNVPRLKGIHYAIESGRLAAESAFRALQRGEVPSRVGALDSYDESLREGALWKELYEVRNMRQAFDKGFLVGGAVASMMTVTKGRMPNGRFPTHPNSAAPLMRTGRASRYPSPDGKYVFDKLSSVFLSNTNHEEDQPVHLQLRDDAIPATINLALYDGPEQRYCPAGVYEFVDGDAGDKAITRPAKRLQINAANCVHCKTCDIKDPLQNIHWVTPEGGGGPNYPNM